VSGPDRDQPARRVSTMRGILRWLRTMESAMSPGTFMQLFERSVANGSRSTVMTPLAWMIGILLAALVALIPVSAPSWIIQWVTGLFVVSAVIYIAGFVYFGLTNPELLRTERFSLSKMAIEKSVRGDSLLGLVGPSQGPDDHLLLPGQPPPKPESMP
jgi:predicted membrane channel-forming protein YqfA (hemolysin III family)